MSKLGIFLLTYLGRDILALPVLANSGMLLSISDEGSSPGITLSGASELA